MDFIRFNVGVKIVGIDNCDIFGTRPERQRYQNTNSKHFNFIINPFQSYKESLRYVLKGFYVRKLTSTGDSRGSKSTTIKIVGNTMTSPFTINCCKSFGCQNLGLASSADYSWPEYRLGYAALHCRVCGSYPRCLMRNSLVGGCQHI